jgi:hypothetical protein
MNSSPCIDKSFVLANQLDVLNRAFQCQKIFKCSITVSITLVLTFAILDIIAKHVLRNGFLQNFSSYLFVIFCIITICLNLMSFIGLKRIKRMVGKFSEANDVCTLSSMLYALSLDQVYNRPAAIAILKKILPEIDRHQQVILNDSERLCLYEALAISANPIFKHYDPEFALIAVRSLQYIGDSKALPFVQAIVENNDPKVKTENFRNEAEAILPWLQQIAAQDYANRTLVRPAAPGTSTSPDTLLRATVGDSSNRSN